MKEIETAGNAAFMGPIRCAYKILIGKLEGTEPSERIWIRSEDNKRQR
jgi:hypothetical protein